MTAVDLAALGITKEELQDRLVERMATQLLTTYNTSALHRIERKLDDFTAEQRVINHGLDKRISEVSAHVIGPDGKNGLRSRVEALEERET